MRATFVVVAAMLPCAATAQAPAPARTSADDCAALGAILQDGSASHPRPTSQMATDSYAMDCDWRALGMETPKTTSQKSGGIYSIVNPGYPNDGQRREFEMDYLFWGKDERFVGGSTRYCTARKRDGTWRFDACRIGVIAN